MGRSRDEPFTTIPKNSTGDRNLTAIFSDRFKKSLQQQLDIQDGYLAVEERCERRDF